MSNYLLKLSLALFAVLTIGAVLLFNGQLFKPDASQLALGVSMSPTVNESVQTSPTPSPSTSDDLYNFQPTIYPSPIIDPGYTPPNVQPSGMPTMIVDPGYTPPVPSPVASATSPSVPSPVQSPTSSPVASSAPSPATSPSPTMSCQPYGWFSFRRQLPPCPKPSPIISPTPTNCSRFGFLAGFFGWRVCPPPFPSPGLPSPTTSNSVPSPSGSPNQCQAQSSTITIYRPWWAFWMPKVTLKYGKCPSPSPSSNPSSQPSSKPSQKPSPTPSGKKSPKPSPSVEDDTIRLYVDLGLKTRHDDMEFNNKRATLYWYATAQGERKISINADTRIKRDQKGYWYIDFKPADLGEKVIPTANYCVEIAYRFKVGSLTGNQYPAATYVTYSDREQAFGQGGVFTYDTTRYGLFETIGYEFREPTPQHRVFCPTNNPSY